MARQTLVLSEYGRSVIALLGDDEAAQLAAASDRWQQHLGTRDAPLSVMPAANGHHRLRAAGVAGFIATEDIIVEVMPKFLDGMPADTGGWRRALWQTLAAAEERPLILDQIDATGSASAIQSDLVGRAFLSSLTAGVARGVHRTYANERATLSVLRGSLDPSALPTFAANPWKVPCSFMELSTDTDLNRLLCWAAKELASSTRSSQLSRELHAGAALLGRVGRTPPTTRQAARIRLGPLHASLEGALEIARLLLDRHSLDPGPGTSSLSGFLWKSEDVFERFVFAVGRAAGQPRGLRAHKSSVRLAQARTAERRALTTEPDICWSAGGAVLVVGDAKYKLDNLRPQASDAYQVMAGARVHACETAALFYPLRFGTHESDLEWDLEGNGDPQRLHAVAIDMSLMEREDGFRRLTAELGARLDQWLGVRQSTGAPQAAISVATSTS